MHKTGVLVMQKYFVGFLIAACSLTVVASEIAAYNTESEAVLTATTHCSSELAQLSKDGLVDVATVSRLEDREVYSLHFSSGGYAPTFNTYPVGTLSVSKVRDAGRYVYSCLITN